MKPSTTAIIVIGILAFGGWYAYKSKFWEKSKTVIFSKEDAAKLLIDNKKNADKSFLLSLDVDFLNAWANAVLSNKPDFTFQGKKYNTQGGKSLTMIK